MQLNSFYLLRCLRLLRSQTQWDPKSFWSCTYLNSQISSPLTKSLLTFSFDKKYFVKCHFWKMRFQKYFLPIVICTLFILLLRRIQKFWQCIRLLGNWAWKNMFGFLFWNLFLCRMELPELHDRGAKRSFQKFAICYLFVFARGYVPIYSC